MTEDTQTTEDNSKTLPFMLGEKKGMTQVFDEDGNVHAATVVDAGPVTVVQMKTDDNDGYSALQFGYGTRKEKRVSKAQQGHTKKARDAAGVDNFKMLIEYQPENDNSVEVGDTFDVSSFTVGDAVDVSGISKGKGFQGVVKRHGFAGGRRTHGGQKSPERGPGSIGATGPSHVFKGTRMAGRMGARRATVQNLEIVHIDADDGTLYIRGGLPGPKGSLLEIHKRTN